ncbi:tumor necrosis factor receptor superfamily member EDAR-like [Acanthaster planci]|uniref:Tumor necrosis factor receptor superfamily member EDAR-like n=1 Tax=Acanthaster planci TaxID=133434 RepID=A0A8B7Z1R6_ACAPL|nr:tumor necrosis factor receptor superfamily member EDAR-like [Acanthaster planci]
MRSHPAAAVMASTLSVGVLAACLITTAGAPTAVPSCSNLADGTPQFYDEQNQQCHPCERCDPGEGLSEVCGDGLGKNAQCLPCKEGTFSPVSRAHVCDSCRLCDNTQNDKIPCTRTTDRECGPCKPGYFRHDERNDHCVSCADERHIYLYPDCLRSTSPPAGEDPHNRGLRNLTSSSPSPIGSPLRSPFTIVLIVILVIVVVVVVVIVVLTVKFCPPKCVHNNATTRGSPTLENNRTRGSNNSDPQPENTRLITPAPDPSQTTPTGERTQRAIPFEEPPTDDDNEAVPSVPSSVCDEGQTDNDGSDDRRGSNQSSASNTTRDSSTLPGGDPQDKEAKRSQFLERFQQAKKYTKDVTISQMHRADKELLRDHMHEDPQRLHISTRFNFVRFAELFDIPEMEVRKMHSALDVLDYLAAHREVELTVPELCQILYDSHKCCHIVRDLVNEIIDRVEQKFS